MGTVIESVLYLSQMTASAFGEIGRRPIRLVANPGVFGFQRRDVVRGPPHRVQGDEVEGLRADP